MKQPKDWEPLQTVEAIAIGSLILLGVTVSASFWIYIYKVLWP